MSEIFEIILNNAIFATLLAGCVVLLGRCFSKPVFIHLLWVIVLLKFVTPPLIPIIFPFTEIDFATTNPSPEKNRSENLFGRINPQKTDLTNQCYPENNHTDVISNLKNREASIPDKIRKFSQPVTQSEVANDISPVSQKMSQMSRLSVDEILPAYGEMSTMQKGNISEGSRKALFLFPYYPVIAYVWLLGMGVCFALFAMRILRFQRILRFSEPAHHAMQEEAEKLARRIGLSNSPRVLIVPGRVSPMLWAPSKTATILFPSDLIEKLDPLSLSTLLLHELSHFRRRDHWIRMLECLVTAIYWWYPVVWWIRHRLHSVEEECCDRCVISEMPHSREIYASALLAVLGHISRTHAPLPPMASGISHFKFVQKRLTNIMLETGANVLSRWGRASLMIIAFALLPLLPTFTHLQADFLNTEVSHASDLNSFHLVESPSFLWHETASHAKEKEGGKSHSVSIPPLTVLRRSGSHPTFVEMSPDGKTMAVGNTAGSLEFWNLHEGKVINEITSHNCALRSAIFSPDGLSIAVIGIDGNVRIYKVSNQQKPEVLRELSGGIISIVYTPNGRLLLGSVTLPDGQTCVKAWETSTFHELWSIASQETPIDHLALSPDGQTLAIVRSSASHVQKEEGITLWDVTSLKHLVKLPNPDETEDYTSVEFAPHGTLLAATDKQNRIVIWNLNGKSSGTIISTSSMVSSIAFHPSQNLLASIQQDGEMVLWNPLTGDRITRFEGHVFDDQLIKRLAPPSSVTFSSDGSIIASSGSDGTVKLWADSRIAELSSLHASGYLYSVVVSKNAEYLLTGGNDGAALWDFRQKRRIRTFAKDLGKSIAVSISPDGSQVLTGGDLNNLYLWELATGKLLHRLEGHTNTIRSTQFSSDGKTALSGAYDGSAILWNLESGREIQRFSGHNDRVNTVAFSSDGHVVATGGTFTVRIWNVETGEEIHSLHTGSPVASLAFNSGGNQLLTALNDASLRLWDLRTGKQLQHFFGHTKPLEAVAISPDGRFVASGGQDKRVLVWDIDNPRAVHQLGVFDTTVKDVTFSPDGKSLITAGADGYTRIWNLHRQVETRGVVAKVRRWGSNAGAPPVEIIHARNTIQTDKKNTSFVAFSPHDSIFVTAGSDKIVKLWNAETRQLQKSLVGHQAGIASGAFSPNGKLLATGSWAPENSVRVWDLETGTLLACLQGHTEPIRMVSISSDGTILASASEDKTVRLWDLSTFKILRTLPKQMLPVFSVSFSSDGRTLATGTGSLAPYRPGIVKLWNVSTGKELRTIDGFKGLQSAVTFSSDGKLLASKKAENIISWIEIATGKQGLNLLSTAGPIEFSPNGRHLASGHLDGSIRIWDITNGYQIAELRQHQSHVRSISFSHDGKTLASSSLDGMVKLWDIVSMNNRHHRGVPADSPGTLASIR